MSPATVTICPDLVARAAVAWQRLVASEGKMPPELAAGIALDYCCDDTTDDREQVKRALYGAAAKWLDWRQIQPDEWDFTSRTACHAIRKADWVIVRVRIDRLRSVELESTKCPEWLAWCDRADLALTLCRAIEGA